MLLLFSFKAHTVIVTSNVEFLVMAALLSRCGHYIFVLWLLWFLVSSSSSSSSFFLSSFFFLAYSQRSQSGCLPYFYTWCGLSANLECRSEMCSTRLAENTARKNDAKNRHLGNIAQFVGLNLRNDGMYRQSENTC